MRSSSTFIPLFTFLGSLSNSVDEINNDERPKKEEVVCECMMLADWNYNLKRVLRQHQTTAFHVHIIPTSTPPSSQPHSRHILLLDCR